MNLVVKANKIFKEVDFSKKRYVVMKGSARPDLERAWTPPSTISSG